MQTPPFSPSLATAERVYSVSQLKLYELCPKRYQFQHIDRIKTETQHIESYVGCRVHDALEHLHKLLDAGQLPSISDLLGYYWRQWELLWSNQIEMSQSPNGREWHRRFGEKCLRRYYTYFYPFHTPEIALIGLEWKFQITLQGEQRIYRMRGKLDRLSRHIDGTYIIHDYKTAKYVPSYHKLQSDIQPGVYQLAVQHTFVDAHHIEVLWFYLASQRELNPTLPQHALAALERSLIQRIEEIEACTEFVPRLSPACRFCDYKQHCPAYQEQRFSQGAERRRYLPTDWGD
ncbi:PD-(D/E)XK nuclease family protein [Myxococcota bacterium]|nr:PD-(D/E)XK nuclease family protein [Myxococcota bacterium]